MRGLRLDHASSILSEAPVKFAADSMARTMGSISTTSNGFPSFSASRSACNRSIDGFTPFCGIISPRRSTTSAASRACDTLSLMKFCTAFLTPDSCLSVSVRSFIGGHFPVLPSQFRSPATWYSTSGPKSMCSHIPVLSSIMLHPARPDLIKRSGVER